MIAYIVWWSGHQLADRYTDYWFAGEDNTMAKKIDFYGIIVESNTLLARKTRQTGDDQNLFASVREQVEEYKGEYTRLCTDLRQAIQIGISAGLFASGGVKTPSGQSVRKGQILALTRRYSRAVKLDSNGKFEIRGSSNPVVKPVKPVVVKDTRTRILDVVEESFGAEYCPQFVILLDKVQQELDKKQAEIEKQAENIRKRNERARNDATKAAAVKALIALGYSENDAKEMTSKRVKSA